VQASSNVAQLMGRRAFSIVSAHIVAQVDNVLAAGARDCGIDSAIRDIFCTSFFSCSMQKAVVALNAIKIFVCDIELVLSFIGTVFERLGAGNAGEFSKEPSTRWDGS